MKTSAATSSRTLSRGENIEDLDVLHHETLLNSVLGVNREDLDVLHHGTLLVSVLGGNFEPVLHDNNQDLECRDLLEICCRKIE